MFPVDLRMRLILHMHIAPTPYTVATKRQLSTTAGTCTVNAAANCQPTNYSQPPTTPQVVVTSEVVEVRQGWGGGGLDGSVTPWAFLTMRLYKGAAHVELDWTVGPIPIKDGVGREVVLRVGADRIASGGVWWTDANGREMVLRRRNWRPTWDLQV